MLALLRNSDFKEVLSFPRLSPPLPILWAISRIFLENKGCAKSIALSTSSMQLMVLNFRPIFLEIKIWAVINRVATDARFVSRT